MNETRVNLREMCDILQQLEERGVGGMALPGDASYDLGSTANMKAVAQAYVDDGFDDGDLYIHRTNSLAAAERRLESRGFTVFESYLMEDGADVDAPGWVYLHVPPLAEATSEEESEVEEYYHDPNFERDLNMDCGVVEVHHHHETHHYEGHRVRQCSRSAHRVPFSDSLCSHSCSAI